MAVLVCFVIELLLLVIICSSSYSEILVFSLRLLRNFSFSFFFMAILKFLLVLVFLETNLKF